MKIRIALVLGLILAVGSGCASYGTPKFKDSPQAYDKDFDTVWNACLKSLDEESINRADKNTHEISTMPTQSSAFLGTMEKYTTIKVSEKRPYLVRVRVMATKTTRSAGAGIFAAQESKNSASDEGAEREILAKIDALLK